MELRTGESYVIIVVLNLHKGLLKLPFRLSSIMMAQGFRECTEDCLMPQLARV